MSTHSTSMNRRDLIRNGGIALSLGAVLAACGSDRSGSDAPGRIGVVLTPEEPDIDLTVDDAVLLRTLQSMEYAMIELHSALLEMGAFGAAASVAEQFVADHQRHADELGSLVSQAGGSPYECANPFMMDRAVEPTLAAVEGSDDAERDALNVAEAFESILGESYQAVVAKLADGALRSPAMLLGGENHRHAAVIALAIDPEAVFHPEVTGEEPADTGEFPKVYAVPATFGPLTGIEVVAGAPQGEEQARFSVTLQTPAENAYVYNDLSC